MDALRKRQLGSAQDLVGVEGEPGRARGHQPGPPAARWPKFAITSAQSGKRRRSGGRANVRSLLWSGLSLLMDKSCRGRGSSMPSQAQTDYTP